MSTKLVAYYRVSTKRQGDSGLGLEGQVAAVAAYAGQAGARLVASFTEVESGSRSDNRPELDRALARAKSTGSVLVIAKLDRLSRDPEFLFKLMNERVRFVACDMPEADETMVGIMAVFAKRERQMTSVRTKAALAAYKAGNRVSKRIHEKYPKGVPAKVLAERAGKLGSRLPESRPLTAADRAKGTERGAAANVAAAAKHAEDVAPLVCELRAGGATLAAIAAELNAREHVTRTGKPYSHVAVLRILNRYA